ncbi:MAG: tyrosine-type recombinase/integrase [Candidatus Methanomethylicaceae archaeon]
MRLMEWQNTIREFLTEVRQVQRASENTVLAYQNDLSQFAEFLSKQFGPEEDWNQVDENALNIYTRDWLMKQHYTSSTLARKIAALRTFFRWLFQRGLVDEDPSTHLRPPKLDRHLPRVLNEQEVQRLFEVITHSQSSFALRDRALFEVIYTAGLRVSEALELRLRDVDLANGFVFCARDTAKERALNLTRSAVNALETYLRHRREVEGDIDPDAYLFANSRGNKLTRQTVWQAIQKYGEQAGLGDDITPSTLRHSRAVHLLREGSDINHIRELLGHAHTSTTHLYRQLYNRIYSGSTDTSNAPDVPDVPEHEQQTADVPEHEQQTACVLEHEQQTADVPEHEQQTACVLEHEQQTADVPEHEQQTACVLEHEQQTADVPEHEQQTACVLEHEQQTADVPEHEQQTADVPEHEQHSPKGIAPSLS